MKSAPTFTLQNMIMNLGLPSRTPTVAQSNCACSKRSHRRQSRHINISTAATVAVLIANIIFNIQSATAFTPSFSKNLRNSRIQSPPITNSALESSTLDNPPSEMSDFQRRMRNLMNKQQTTTRTTTRKNRRSKAPDNLQIVKTLDEYKNTVCQQENLVVVRFYAPWCKACKAVAPSYYRMAVTYPHVSFVDVPVTSDNAQLHQGLGVPSLPFAHIYHPTGGLVEEMKMSKKFFRTFANTLKNYIDGYCSVDEYEELEAKKIDNTTQGAE